MTHGEPYDAIVIGGGPAGATAAREMAKRDLRVVLLERSTFPRFHIGESFLPANFAMIKQLGLGEALARLPHVPKAGATFTLGHGRQEPVDFWFKDCLGDVESMAFNIERSQFDAMLLDAARDAGAEVRVGVKVQKIANLDDGDVHLETSDGPVGGRYLVDASGSATIVGRHLRTRRVLVDLKMVAYFGHFTGVARRDGIKGGFPTVVMCEDGWFWLIPIDAERTSVGLVAKESLARRVGVPARGMLRWAIERCPVVAMLCADAQPHAIEGGEANHNMVEADFSYQCRPYAGPGYFLCGDAATFVDPVFSTGVCLGMVAGDQTAKAIASIVHDGRQPVTARREFLRYIEGSSSAFFRLVRLFYRHEFRELFLQGQGPFSIHRATLTMLSGYVFPRPRFAVRWRMAIFGLLIRLQGWYRIVPRREGFSLERSVPGATMPCARPMDANLAAPARAGATG